MAKEAKRVTIVGAGVVGIATAIYLQRDGHHVTVIDRASPGQATSFGNAGSLAPSSIIPMAVPGTLKQVPKWLTHPLGPLTISWRELPGLLPWFLHFRRVSTTEGAARGARALRSLNRASLHTYQELLASIGAADLVRHDGMLHVYKTQAGFNGSAFARELRAQNECMVEIVEGDRIREIEPALSTEYRWGFFLPDNGHVRNPARVVEVLARHFVANGGVIMRGTVEGFEMDGRRITALRTDRGPVPIACVVLAAGVWSRKLASRLGTRVPVASERGYHIQIPEPGVQLRCPVTDGEGKFVATPMEGGLRIAGTSEFRNADAPPNWARTDALAALAPRLIPQLEVNGYSRWMGTRPSMPDSLPVIGPAPRVDNAWFAFGHGHWGLMAAPATGQLIADLVSGRAPAIDIAPFRPDRF